MCYVKKLWETEFDNIVSRKEKVQDININHSKFKVHDTYEKDEKITTNFEAVSDEVVTNKAYLDEKILKIVGHISLLEKNYDEFKVLSVKQSIEEVLFQGAVKATIQTTYHKRLFDNYNNADEVIKEFLFGARRRLDLE